MAYVESPQKMFEGVADLLDGNLAVGVSGDGLTSHAGSLPAK